jgi:hypothetical protein
VVKRNPALVVALISTSSSALTSRERLLLKRNGLNLLCALGSLGLGEECFDVGLVDKVGSTGKGSAQNEVQEDAERTEVSTSSIRYYGGMSKLM